MKKTLLIIAVLLITSSAAFSQEFKFGAGAVIGSKSGISETGTKMNFGLHARGVYGISDQFALTAGFSYFLPSKVDPVKLTLMGFNADAMYYFMDDNDMKIYGLGGMNIAFAKVSGGGFEASTNDVSFELGAGVEFGKFFVELKYDGNGEQIEGFVGMYF